MYKKKNEKKPLYLVYTPGVCNHSHSKSLDWHISIFIYRTRTLLTPSFVLILDKHFKWLFGYGAAA